MKTCNRCDLPKELTEFSKDKSTKDGLRNRCRECMSEIWKAMYQKDPEKFKDRVREYQEENPEKRKRTQKNADLNSHYGIGLKEFEILLEAQNNKCAICEDLFDRSPHVDHCHKTGRVRALLCFRCNPALGGFRDSISILEKAIEFLRKQT